MVNDWLQNLLNPYIIVDLSVIDKLKLVIIFPPHIFFFLDTPVVLVQLVENPPWIKRDKGKLMEVGSLNLTPISEKKKISKTVQALRENVKKFKVSGL